jgi:MscS family membrane protein
MLRAMSPARATALALCLALSLAPAAAAGQDPRPRTTAAEVPREARAAPEASRAEARPFFERHLPEPLLRPGPRGLLWWQWLALPALVLLALALGAALGWATRRLLGHLTARTRTSWDDAIVDRVSGPLTFLWGVAAYTAFHPWLALTDGANAAIEHVLRAATYLALLWAGFRSVNVAFTAASEMPWTRSSPSLVGLLPLGRKFAKVLLLAMGLVAVLNELGFQVASLLAGLGIGGIALALAAQKTVENLFGSVSIGVDQPFRVGDFVKVEDFVGTVETIGMRSTRFRTLDRTLIAIPNGRLADMRIETFTARDRFRLFANLGLVYSTTVAQMRQVMAGFEATLRAHPKIWPEAVVIRFNEFRDSSLNIEVMAWFQTADWNEFTAARAEIFLAFMEVVEAAGTSFAFPTRTVHVVGGPTLAPEPEPEKQRARSKGPGPQ